MTAAITPGGTDAIAGCMVYISNAIDGDISIFHLDTVGGQLTPQGRRSAGEAVMPMTLSADRQQLYAVTRGQSRQILGWAIAAGSGDLVAAASTGIDSSLAYLSADPSGRWLLGASYGEHRLCLYALERIQAGDGEPLQIIDGIAHAHAAVWSPDGRFVYVSALGSDTLYVFALHDERHGQLQALAEVHLEPGFGPRHLCLSPDADVLYVLSEMRGVVAVLRRDAVGGQVALQQVSARPACLADLRDGVVRSHPNAVPSDPSLLASLIWAADLQLGPDGRFLYFSERSSSRLVALRAGVDGLLSEVGCIETEAQPRGFRIDPSGRWLVACGERSQQITVYSIDVDSGALTPQARCAGGRGANWVEIVIPGAAG